MARHGKATVNEGGSPGGAARGAGAVSPSQWLTIAALAGVVVLLGVVVWRSGIFQPRQVQSYKVQVYTTKEDDGIDYTLRYEPQRRDEIDAALRGGLDEEAEWFWVPRLTVKHPGGAVVEEGAFQPFPIVSGDAQTDEPDNLKERKEGPWILRHSNGQRQAEYTLVGGKPQGQYTAWHENGYVAEKGAYEAGDKTGTWKRWHSDGTLAAEQHYAQGQLTGTEELFYAGGRPESRTEYVAGKRHGEHREWHENGRLRAEGHFQDDARHGRWVLYAESGVKTDERVYENGRLVQAEG